jgi:hypothetical protein
MRIEDYLPVQHFTELHAMIVLMVEAPGGSPISAGMEWQNDRQTLSTKFVQHLHTIMRIHAGSTMQVGSGSVEFIDHGSVKVLARAVLENFIVFACLFGDPDPEACRFRHMTWKLGGLLDRQSMKASTAANLAKLAVEKEQIDQLFSEVSGHLLYASLAKGQQKAIAKGDWKTGRSWQLLAKEAGFSEGYFRNIYAYLCGYSHSSYAAALQVGQANQAADQVAQSSSMLGVLCLCMARFAVIYANLFPLAREVLAQQRGPSFDMWNIDAARFDQLYAGR